MMILVVILMISTLWWKSLWLGKQGAQMCGEKEESFKLENWRCFRCSMRCIHVNSYAGLGSGAPSEKVRIIEDCGLLLYHRSIETFAFTPIADRQPEFAWDEWEPNPWGRVEIDISATIWDFCNPSMVIRRPRMDGWLPARQTSSFVFFHIWLPCRHRNIRICGNTASLDLHAIFTLTNDDQCDWLACG